MYKACQYIDEMLLIIYSTENYSYSSLYNIMQQKYLLPYSLFRNRKVCIYSMNVLYCQKKEMGEKCDVYFIQSVTVSSSCQIYFRQVIDILPYFSLLYQIFFPKKGFQKTLYSSLTDSIFPSLKLIDIPPYHSVQTATQEEIKIGPHTKSLFLDRLVGKYISM